MGSRRQSLTLHRRTAAKWSVGMPHRRRPPASARRVVAAGRPQPEPAERLATSSRRRRSPRASADSAVPWHEHMFASSADGSSARTRAAALPLGGPDSNPALSAPKPRVLPLHHPPAGCLAPRDTTMRPMPAPTVVILAAGEGTRMRSALPKVLHPICGRPMILWPLLAARAAGAERVIVGRQPEAAARRAPARRRRDRDPGRSRAAPATRSPPRPRAARPGRARARRSTATCR